VAAATGKEVGRSALVCAPFASNSASSGNIKQPSNSTNESEPSVGAVAPSPRESECLVYGVGTDNRLDEKLIRDD